MRTLTIAILFALVSVAGKVLTPPQESTTAACDNIRDSHTKGVDHTCECEHATHCDPTSDDDRQSHKSMGPKCRTYCRPDHCDCQNECTS
jgi:hypothetical protein